MSDTSLFKARKSNRNLLHLIALLVIPQTASCAASHANPLFSIANEVPSKVPALSAKNATAPNPQISQSALSILEIVRHMEGENPIPRIKVPFCIYNGVLQELKNHSAMILQPGAPLPKNAKSVFSFESEHNEMHQVIYF